MSLSQIPANRKHQIVHFAMPHTDTSESQLPQGKAYDLKPVILLAFVGGVLSFLVTLNPKP